jgi:HEXXH motif-containing protein
MVMERLRDAEPELCGEVETIVRDIVVTRPHETNVLDYTGATSFALWGALVLNSERHPSWVHFYRQIVHEAGHNLLYGISRDAPLVLNGPADLLPSPIRTTPRPVEGVFQAAFVSAREVLALDALLSRHDEAACLSDDEAALIWDLLERSGLAFWDCLETLRHGARLSASGATLLADCEAYMAANFAIEPR